MPVRNEEDLLEALAAGEFDRLLDTPEDERLDFKSQPYQLQLEAQKWELAKDVAAFANTSGGHLLLGVKTSRRPNEIGDLARSHSFIAKNLVEWPKYLDVFKDWIYPLVRGVSARWYPEDSGRTDGLLLITIPPQRSDEQPFVLRRMLTRENEPPIAALGIPERRGDQVHWVRAETLHHRLVTLRGGTDSSSANGTLGVHEERSRRADARIESVVREAGWTGRPTYFLQALAPLGTRFTSEFHARDGLRGALENPQSLRHNGFNLRTLGAIETRDGSLAYLADPRRALWLERDGLFTAGAVADAEYLGWGTNRNRAEGEPTRVNPTVLVEFTLEFFRFVYRDLEPRAPGRWTFRVVGRGWKELGGGLELGPGEAQNWMLSLRGSEPASGDNLLEEIQGTGSAPHDAFRILEAVYGFFGLEPSAIPLTSGESISEEQLLRL